MMRRLHALRDALVVVTCLLCAYAATQIDDPAPAVVAHRGAS